MHLHLPVSDMQQEPQLYTRTSHLCLCEDDLCTLAPLDPHTVYHRIHVCIESVSRNETNSS